MIALQIFLTILTLAGIVGTFLLLVWHGMENSHEEIPTGLKVAFGACLVVGLLSVAGSAISLIWALF